MANTPLVKLDNLYLKREDQNLTGSTKDRAIPLQIKNLKKQGYQQAVISSTGNAAISAAHFCRQHQIKLIIFLSPKINPNKLNLLKKYEVEIIISPQPISDAVKFSKNNSSYLLRQSTDPIAQIGYQQIAIELTKQLPQISSLFVPIGSGTTLLGISQKLPPYVHLFGCQSVANSPISRIFDTNFTPETRLITDALSAKFLPHKNQIIQTIKKFNGHSFTIQNKAIISADDYFCRSGITTSLEGALAFAAYKKALQNNFSVGDFPVILLTGAKR